MGFEASSAALMYSLARVSPAFEPNRSHEPGRGLIRDYGLPLRLLQALRAKLTWKYSSPYMLGFLSAFDVSGDLLVRNSLLPREGAEVTESEDQKSIKEFELSGTRNRRQVSTTLHALNIVSILGGVAAIFNVPLEFVLTVTASSLTVLIVRLVTVLRRGANLPAAHGSEFSDGR